MRRGYRRVSADFSSYLGDPEDPPGVLPQRGAMLQALRHYFTAHGFDANWDAIEGMADNDLVVTLSMVCPFDPVERQALLEAADFAGAGGNAGDAAGNWRASAAAGR